MEMSWNLDLSKVSSMQKSISLLCEYGLGVEALVQRKGTPRGTCD